MKIVIKFDCWFNSQFQAAAQTVLFAIVQAALANTMDTKHCTVSVSLQSAAPGDMAFGQDMALAAPIGTGTNAIFCNC